MEQRLSLREVQLAELNILKHATDFMDKHGIKYALAYGTLLGAIRHDAFIPWDDDIDILVPRDDYEKLKALIKSGVQVSDANPDIAFLLPGDKGYKYPFVKAVDLGYAVDDTNEYIDGVEANLWVDVFPLNHFPDNWHHYNACYTIIHLFAKVTQYDVVAFKKGNIKSTLLKVIARTIAFCMGGYQNVAIAADKISYRMHKRNKSSNHVGDGAWGRNISYWPLNQTEELIKHRFEDAEFYIPKEYDAVLRHVYNDYMQIPPVEKRQSHYLQVHKK